MRAQAKTISTDRLATHVRIAGDPGRPPLLLVHGNASSSVFFDRVQEALSEHYYVLAPDLRGFGDSEAKPVDATRGMRDFSDDLAALLASPEAGVGDRAVHVIGWSAGGNVGMQLAMDHGARVASLTLINPGSPFGFGGTKGLDGTPCYDDFAGSGGGTANPQFVELMAAKDTGSDQQASPRNVMNAFYWKPPFRPEPAREDAYLDGLLATATGPDNYPGDMNPSANWPNVAPGTRGINNALSPKFCNQGGFADIAHKPAVLWIRGADDQIVSDRSMFDFGVLGEFGVVPGWPGAEVFPAQPMVSQMRAVLERYKQNGGEYRESVILDCGHGPHIEAFAQFMTLVDEFLPR